MNRSRLLHMLMMVVCIIPMGLVLFYFLQGGGISGFEFNYFWLILLLCPLMHIFMMKHMGHGHGHNHNNHNHSHNQDHSHSDCHQDEIDPTEKKEENRL